MNRLFHFFFIAILSFAIAACSGTSETVREKPGAKQADEQNVPPSPDWFSDEGTVVQGDSVTAYGSAVAVNSEQAVSAARDRAMLLLKQAISDRLETLRSEAAEEMGDNPDLGSPGFLISFRNAADAVAGAASPKQHKTVPVASGTGMRGFAVVLLSKKKLIEHMDSELGSHRESWSAIKESAAFRNF